jgi:PAS domain S-box-containing protein
MGGQRNMTRGDMTRALHSLESSPDAPDEFKHLLRELQRHQLELEVQNRELQEAQQELEESRNRYVELYDFAPMACVSLNARACIQDLNLTGASLLGQARTYLQGLPFTPFVHPQDVSRFLLHVRRCIEGETLSTELRLRIGHKQIEGRLHSAPLDDGGPRERLCRTAILDITELRQMQQRLSLAERLAAVGTLATGIAHEVNNPLAFLMGSLELATRALRAPEPQPVQPVLEALANARSGAERIQDIVQELSAFARSPEARREGVDVEEVLELSLKMAMVELRHRAQVVRDYEEVPKVLADGARLGQVFLNLLVNAAQAIPEGMAARHQVRLRIRASEEAVLVQVQDTGEGIPADILERIFEPFFTTKEPGAGLGLGLAISHSIVSQMGGSLGVESTLGQGSTFSIRLPVAPPSREALSPPAVERRPGAAPRRGSILIVDDERLFGHTLRLLLGDAHEVTYTPSASEALDWIRGGRRYDAILCDLMMAEVTGRQFHEALRASSPEAAQRVIFMTGGAYTPSSLDFVARMTNPILMKPFKPEELEKLLLPLLPPA